MRTLLLSLLLLPPFSAQAADKVLNGGGVWICENANLDITSSVLVDFYEAENEFQWTLVQSNRSDPQQIADDILASARVKFPAYADAWAATLNEMRARFTQIAGELTIAEDSKYRAKPLPSLCRTGGGWQYRQFANWNDTNNRGIIRKDYWESPKISTLDKAGLIWHEVVYRWLRVNHHDKDSTRAREIVGVLFAENNAQFTVAMAQARLQEILRRPVEPVDPTEGAWVCAFKMPQTSFWTLAYGDDEREARRAAMKKCEENTGGFPGFPGGGGIPGSPFPIPGMCMGVEHEMECGAITSTEPRNQCSVSYRRAGDEKKFSANGRSLLEARVKALIKCGEAVGQNGAWLCGDPIDCQ